MDQLGYKEKELIAMDARHTAREISQQPDLWLKIWKIFQPEVGNIRQMIHGRKFKRIILTGAGTSAFIGLSLHGLFRRHFNVIAEAISTTDLVSHPRDFFTGDDPVLMISFARSGNSPESLAAVQLADQFYSNCYHLIITCNRNGELARCKTRNQNYVFFLPDEANDESLAMTSSYTGMLLTGILVALIDKSDQIKDQITQVASYARTIIRDKYSLIRKIAEKPFKRAVFLGSGPQTGTATESHLKLQELTDGKVICKHDSYLGFRHGPKAVIDDETLVVYMFSNDPHVLKYELDLVKAMSNGKQAMVQIGIMESNLGNIPLDLAIIHTENGVRVDEEFLTLPNVVVAQLLGFYKSLSYGLSPDRPSKSGAISRVVEGVNIYTIS